MRTKEPQDNRQAAGIFQLKRRGRAGARALSSEGRHDTQHHRGVY